MVWSLAKSNGSMVRFAGHVVWLVAENKEALVYLPIWEPRLRLSDPDLTLASALWKEHCGSCRACR